jgi:hypothetical protein
MFIISPLSAADISLSSREREGGKIIYRGKEPIHN